MTRIVTLPVEKWDPDFKAMFGGEAIDPMQRVAGGTMAHAPEMAKAMMGFTGALFQHTALPRRLIELVRLRIAFHNQCRSCMAVRHQSALNDGLTENDICALEKPTEAANLSAAEKAAIAYADVAATNHFAVNDQTFESLRKHFAERQIIELQMFVGYFIGFGRMIASWDMVEVLPKPFQDKSTKVAPWSIRESVVMNA